MLPGSPAEIKPASSPEHGKAAVHPAFPSAEEAKKLLAAPFRVTVISQLSLPRLGVTRKPAS